MENIIKNKLLIVLVLFIILTTTMCSSVFASETTTYNYSFNSDSKNFHAWTHRIWMIQLPRDMIAIRINVDDFEGLSNHIVEVSEGEGYFYIYVYYYEGDVSFVSDDTCMRVNIGEGGSATYSFYGSWISDVHDGGIISFPTSNNGYLTSDSFTTSVANYSQRLKYYYGDCAVFDNNGNEVFQGAPQGQEGGITNPANPVEEITTPGVQVELMKPTQVEEILPQIIAVVEIVLPIFLGIFGVLLVLYLIKSKNLLHL